MKKEEKKEKLIYIVLIIIITLQSYWIFNLQNNIKKIRCDLVDAINAEREYTYPILRTIDDPNNYGKDILSPIITDSFYYCENL